MEERSCFSLLESEELRRYGLIALERYSEAMAIDKRYFDEILFMFVFVSPWDEDGFWGRVREPTPLERVLLLMHGRIVSFVVEISKELWDSLSDDERVLLLAELLSGVVLRSRGVNRERGFREPLLGQKENLLER